MRIIYTFLFCFLSISLFAQEGTLVGKVVFSDGHPAAYVNVTLEGTTITV